MSTNTRAALYFNPPTHHFLADRLFDVTYASHAGDQILAPYVHMKQFLNSNGIDVHTADYLPTKPDSVRKIYVSSGNPANCKHLIDREDVVLSAFLALECPTVEPSLYRELKHEQHLYKRVFSWSDSASLEPFVGGSLRCLPLHWPQSYDSVHSGIWERTNRGFLVMLNGNKLPRYKSPCRELYSERLKAIEYFAQSGDIDLYGIGWDRDPMRVGKPYLPGTFRRVPIPGTVQSVDRIFRTLWRPLFPDARLAAAQRVYRGVAASKAQVLGAYKFALCFENSVLKGWVTEKLFDCFFAGAIPIYWGAPNIEDYVSTQCFIDMRQFKNYIELKRYLKSLTANEIETYRNNARDFLSSPRFQPFTKQAFADLFARIVEEDAEIKLM